MVRFACALVGLGVFLVAPLLAADAPTRFQTNFTFDVHFVDGVRTYNENLGIVVDVWLPPTFGWKCLRLSPATVEGRVRDSFGCSNDGFKTEVLTLVGCKADQADTKHTSGMRLFATRPDGQPQGTPLTTDAGAPIAGNTFGTYVDLTASCETVAVR